MDPQTQQEAHELLSALLDGVLGPDQQDRLRDLLHEHVQVRDLYLVYLDLHAELALRGDLGVTPLPEPLAGADESPRDRVEKENSNVGPGQPTPAPGGRRPRLRAPRRTHWLGLIPLGLAVLAIALFLGPGLRDRTHVDPAPSHQAIEKFDDTVAVLLQTHRAVWEETGLPTWPGAPLPPGRLALKSGFAYIEFYEGATVILQGPAELRLISRSEAYCTRGKLRAMVPPQAQGFTIGSPALDLVDQGTEFGLEVGEDRTAVQVFRGKVDLYDAGADRAATPPKALSTGQGVRRDASGMIRPIALDPASFLTAQELEARAKDETRQRHLEWLAASETLSRDPSLLVYYPFQRVPSSSRTLPDRAGGRQPRHDAVIVGCTWVKGRWPGKQALEFSQVSDRVRFDVPGEHDAVTMMAWVRLDALPDRNNSLMMCDGWEEGEPHWQINGSGTIILGVQGSPKGRAAHYRARNVLTPDRLRRWTHLAVVYDRKGGQVVHYVDGQPTGRERLISDIPLRFGEAEIGNWNTASHHTKGPIRHLVGAMDEFMLFSRALSEQEIGRLYVQGQLPS